MPVTPQQSYVTKMTKATTTSTKTRAIVSKMLLPSLLLLLLLLLMLLMLNTPLAIASAANSSTVAGAQEKDFGNALEPADNELAELLLTEMTLVVALRSYVEALEAKISIIKSKTSTIKSINDVAYNNTDRYVNNPINALTIIKRFTADWKALREYAASAINTDEIVQDIAATTDSLKFPSEEDYDEAAGNLLRIQELYKLEPQRLAVGELNGVKFGSEMSWSDCLEIGRKSDQNGDYAIAKFWMETALGILPAAENATNSKNTTNSTKASNLTTTTRQSQNEKARFEILQTLLITEFNAGNAEAALNIINELLQLRPTHKALLKDKEIIEAELKQQSKNTKKNKKFVEKNKKTKKTDKSEEEQLIAEICRAATTSSSSNNAASDTKYCSLVCGNLPELLLQPLKVEHLSLDPYIVLHHHVFSLKQIANLRELLEEQYSFESVIGDFVEALQFTNMAHKKLARINQKLQLVTGHAGDLFEQWQAEAYNYEDGSEFEDMLVQRKTPHKIAANVLFNLQQSKLGGAIAFPQLELSVQVPTTSMLYWSNLNEFQEEDYRTKQYVCPVIAGTQIMAYTSIRQALAAQ